MIVKSIKYLFNGLVTGVKTLTLIVQLAIATAILGVVAYIAYPFMNYPAPTIPTEELDTDYISWSLYHTSNDLVYQQLTIFRTGKSQLVTTRQSGDYDIPDNLNDIKMSFNKESGIITFSKLNVLPESQARRLFNDAVQKGALDLKTVSNTSKKMIIATHFYGKERKVGGPQHMSHPYHYLHQIYYNRQHWKDVSELISKNSGYRDLLKKQLYVKPEKKNNNDSNPPPEGDENPLVDPDGEEPTPSELEQTDNDPEN